MPLSKLFSTLQPLTLALLGALCVLVFPFLPVAQGISIEQPVAGQIGFSMYGHEGKTALFPQWNPVNYWQSGLQTYWFVLLSAAITVALAWRKEYRAMLWASLATWVTAFYMLQGVVARMGERSGGWLPQLVPFLKNNFNVQAHLLWGWLVLFIGLLLLVIAAGLPLKTSAALRPRSPSLNRAVQPTTGVCPMCGTPNPLTFTKCYKCFAPLPWVKMPTVKPAKVPRPHLTLSTFNFFEMINWGWWAIALVSFLIPPGGLMLYFAYSRNDDEKASAAALGGLLAVALFVLRFTLLMAKSVSPAPT